MQTNPFSSLSKRNKKISHLSRESPTIIRSRYQESPSYQIMHHSPQSINQRLNSLTKVQSQLQKEIVTINLSLQKMHRRMGYKNGILFQVGTDYHLANAVRSIIEKDLQMNLWGLNFQGQLQGYRPYKKGVMLPRVEFSGSIKPLIKITDQNIEKYSFQQYHRPSAIMLDKWQYFSKGATKKYYDQRKRFKTELRNRSEAEYSPSLVVSYNSALARGDRVTDWRTQQMLTSKSLADQRANYSEVKSPQRMLMKSKKKLIIPKDEVLTPPEIFDILEKENKLVSIWLPPSSDPALFGLMSILVRQKQDGINLCLIKKYWWIRKGLTRRIFNCILDWLCKLHGYTDELTLLTKQQEFNAIFAPLGWKLINWMQKQKLRITYKRTML